MDRSENKQSNNRGKPRDYSCMREFNDNRNLEKGFNWADDVEVTEKYDSAVKQGKRSAPSRQTHNKSRSDKWKADKSSRPMPPKGDAVPEFSATRFRARNATPEVAEDLYSVGSTGPLVPITQDYGHNLSALAESSLSVLSSITVQRF